jgi:hypothetical protein
LSRGDRLVAPPHSSHSTVPRGHDADLRLNLRRRHTILQLIASLELVEIDAVVLDRAAHPMPTELGTLDAIHLAMALLWKEMTRVELVMATHDGALAIGARAHGLPIVGVTQS